VQAPSHPPYSFPHSRLRGRRSLESFRMSIAERELKEKNNSTVYCNPSPGSGPRAGPIDGPTMLAPPKTTFLSFGLIKH
jgi:hypothetical protein